MSELRFAFVGRVSTEDNQEPEASKARQLTQAQRILPPGARIVEQFFDIGQSRSLPWPRRPETARLLRELRARNNGWSAIVVGEFARAFGAPIQYSTIYPLLEHFGIELWLPEVGGRVDFTSATTEMLLGMLGGTSKQERALVRSRVRDGMTVLAQDGSRHLGGRPPYGYRLADAGEHPNPKKRALGQRLHRLEPDPVTAPAVERIFKLFAAGLGLKQIANILTADGVPSPSAHDRARNPHRDPRGWAHTAVRTILRNEKYLGKAVWGKQARTDELLDLDDVAAGYVTRQRWVENGRWVYGPGDAHPPLISRELWDDVARRIALTAGRQVRQERAPRATATPYQLRGLLYCGICNRKMVGNTTGGILRYRCSTTNSRSLPAYLADHPKSVYVREDTVTAALDQWLPTLVNPEALAACEAPKATGRDQDPLERRAQELDQSIQRLVAAIEAGADPVSIKPRLATLRQELDANERQRRRTKSASKPSPHDIHRLFEELAGVLGVLDLAEPEERAAIYASLQLRLTYRPDSHSLLAEADLARGLGPRQNRSAPGLPEADLENGFSRVGGGT